MDWKLKMPLLGIILLNLYILPVASAQPQVDNNDIPPPPTKYCPPPGFLYAALLRSPAMSSEEDLKNHALSLCDIESLLCVNCPKDHQEEQCFLNDEWRYLFCTRSISDEPPEDKKRKAKDCELSRLRCRDDVFNHWQKRRDGY